MQKLKEDFDDYETPKEELTATTSAELGGPPDYCRKLEAALNEAGYIVEEKEIQESPDNYDILKSMLETEFPEIDILGEPEEGDSLCDVCANIMC